MLRVFLDNKLIIFNSFAYICLALSFVFGKVYVFTVTGMVLFGILLFLQLSMGRKLLFPSNIPVFLTCSLMQATYFFVNPRNLFHYTGSFFYAVFGIIFFLSLLKRQPYTLFYFFGKVTADTPISSNHYIFTLLWLLIFMGCFVLSLVLMPSAWYLFAPIILVLLGFAGINLLLPRILLIYNRGENIKADNEFTMEQTFEGMKKMFDPDAIPGLNVVIQYRIKGRKGGNWYFVLKDREADLFKGRFPEPKLEISTDTSTWLAIADGQLSGEEAFTKGKLKAKGEMEILMQHDSIFNKKLLSISENFNKDSIK